MNLSPYLPVIKATFAESRQSYVLCILDFYSDAMLNNLFIYIGKAKYKSVGTYYLLHDVIHIDNCNCNIWEERSVTIHLIYHKEPSHIFVFAHKKVHYFS